MILEGEENSLQADVETLARGNEGLNYTVNIGNRILQ